MSESSEDVPLGQRMKKVVAEKKAEDAVEQPLGLTRVRPRPGSMATADGDEEGPSDEELSSDDNEDVPLSQRALKNAKPAKRARAPAKEASAKKPRVAAPRRSGNAAGEKDNKWTTLMHGGVLFPPEYKAHGIKLKYDKVPVDLTDEQEEVATMYASMLETDYMKKETFLKNFWEDFKAVLGAKHVVKDLSKCDFRDIYDHLMVEREAKKELSKEEKVKIKEERDAAEVIYKFATIDDRKEPVGNFRVEPPGLFRGRGEHPKMGKLKRRIYPRDITINIGKGCPIPTHPYPDQKWKEIRHDQTVEWLAFWKDPINPKSYKYVWLGSTSTFKTDSDLAKYEKARKLKDHIDRIRADYQRLWSSKDLQQRQMSTALYFIDKLALRAGHEKDEDEADTVGCCTLKVGNVKMLDENKISFDFLGKDSMRYENEVTVEGKVWKNMKSFLSDASGKAKSPEEQLFDTMDAQHLNVMMKDYMDGLSVKVFRTFDASLTLDRLLWEASESTEIIEKQADYNRANKEVAILCNHQRAVSKNHDVSMQRMIDGISSAADNYEKLRKDLGRAKAGKPTADGKNVSVEVLTKRLATAKTKMDKLVVTKDVKEDLKTVALGTSKLNYLDPRITVAWCKRNEVPMEKIFNKSLLGKFSWAMEVEPEFRF